MLTKWITSNIGITAMIAILLNTFGFMTTRNYIESLCIPAKFLPESPTDYLLWGAKAIVPIAGNIIITLLILVSVFLLVDVCTRFVRRIARFCFRTILILIPKRAGDSLRRFVEAVQTKINIIARISVQFLSRKWHGISPATITGVFFTISLASVIIVAKYSDPFFVRIRDQHTGSLYEAVNHWDAYSYIVTLTSCLLVYGIYRIITSYWYEADFSRTAKLYLSGSIASAVAVILLLVMPYRLVIHGKGERITYNRRSAVIMSESSDEFLVYLPRYDSCVVLDRHDPGIVRDSIRRTVYFYQVHPSGTTVH